jgi:hypothetical protein
LKLCCDWRHHKEPGGFCPIFTGMVLIHSVACWIQFLQSLSKPLETFCSHFILVESLLLLHISLLYPSSKFPLPFYHFLYFSLIICFSHTAWFIGELVFTLPTTIICLVDDIFPVCGVVLFPMGCRFAHFLKVRSWHDPDSCDTVSPYVTSDFFLRCLPSFRLHLVVSCGRAGKKSSTDNLCTLRGLISVPLIHFQNSSLFLTSGTRRRRWFLLVLFLCLYLGWRRVSQTWLWNL